MIKDGSRMESWSSGATFLPLYLGRDGGGKCVLFKKKLVCNFPEDRDLVFTVEVVSRLFHDAVM